MAESTRPSMKTPALWGLPNSFMSTVCLQRPWYPTPPQACAWLYVFFPVLGVSGTISKILPRVQESPAKICKYQRALRDCGVQRTLQLVGSSGAAASRPEPFQQEAHSNQHFKSLHQEWLPALEGPLDCASSRVTLR